MADRDPDMTVGNVIGCLIGMVVFFYLWTTYVMIPMCGYPIPAATC